MSTLFVTTRGGADRQLQGSDGLTVMEVLRNGGIDEVLALCGGCCSCATCRVHVDDEFADALPPVSVDDERSARQFEPPPAFVPAVVPNPFSPALDGLRVIFSPEA